MNAMIIMVGLPEMVKKDLMAKRGYLITKLIMHGLRFHFLFVAVCNVILGFMRGDQHY